MLRTADKRLSVGRPLGSILPKYAPLAMEANSLGVSAAGSSNAKGNYTQVFAATGFDYDGFFLGFEPGVVGDFLCDIAVGAVSSEVDILSNVLISGAGTTFPMHFEVYVPLYVAAGQRLSARLQSTDAGAQSAVFVKGVKGGMYRDLRRRRATTYGAATGDSGGVSIDPGGSADTYPGSFTQIDAAIANPIRGYAIICVGGQNNASRSNAGHQFEIGLGGSGSEVGGVYIDARQDATEDGLTPVLFSRALEASAGTRLSARGRCTITDATDRLADLVVIGFD